MEAGVLFVGGNDPSRALGVLRKEVGQEPGAPGNVVLLVLYWEEKNACTGLWGHSPGAELFGF